MVRDLGPQTRTRAKAGARPTHPPPRPSSDVWSDTAQLRYGGFWYRVIAYTIDNLALTVIFGFCAPVVLAISGLPNPLKLLLLAEVGRALAVEDLSLPTEQLAQVMMSLLATWVVLQWLYEAGLTASRHGGTLGKILLGMRVQRHTGAPVGFARASLRHFAKHLSGLVVMLGFLLAALHPRKRALHDLLAGTVVVFPPGPGGANAA